MARGPRRWQPSERGDISPLRHRRRLCPKAVQPVSGHALQQRAGLDERRFRSNSPAIPGPRPIPTRTSRPGRPGGPGRPGTCLRHLLTMRFRGSPSRKVAPSGGGRGQLPLLRPGRRLMVLFACPAASTSTARAHANGHSLERHWGRRAVLHEAYPRCPLVLLTTYRLKAGRAGRSASGGACARRTIPSFDVLWQMTRRPITQLHAYAHGVRRSDSGPVGCIRWDPGFGRGSVAVLASSHCDTPDLFLVGVLDAVLGRAASPSGSWGLPARGRRAWAPVGDPFRPPLATLGGTAWTAWECWHPVGPRTLSPPHEGVGSTEENAWTTTALHEIRSRADLRASRPVSRFCSQPASLQRAASSPTSFLRRPAPQLGVRGGSPSRVPRVTPRSHRDRTERRLPPPAHHLVEYKGIVQGPVRGCFAPRVQKPSPTGHSAGHGGPAPLRRTESHLPGWGGASPCSRRLVALGYLDERHLRLQAGRQPSASNASKPFAVLFFG